LFSNPQKGTSLREAASFDVFCVKIGGLGCIGRLKNQTRSPVNIFDAHFRAYGKRNPLRDRD